MAKKTKLRAGKGAMADVLTRMIKPPIALTHSEHRSHVVIVKRTKEKGKFRYTFYLKGEEKSKLYNTSCRFVNIIKEGNP